MAAEKSNMRFSIIFRWAELSKITNVWVDILVQKPGRG